MECHAVGRLLERHAKLQFTTDTRSIKALYIKKIAKIDKINESKMVW